MILDSYSKRLDFIVAIIGCIAGAAVATIAGITGASSTLEIGVAVLVASAIYLIFRNKMTLSPTPDLPASKSLGLSLHIVFFLTFAASMCLMHFSILRPQIYFLLTSISVAVVAAGILTAANKNCPGLLLLEIILIAFSLRYGLMYESHGFYGVDPWWHAILIEEWLNIGHSTFYTPSGYASYAVFPMMHLDVMATRLVTQLDPRDSLFCSIGLFYISSISFIFLFGRSLINKEVGLLGALFLSINVSHINTGVWIIPTSFGCAICAFVLWLIYSRKYNMAYASILIVVSVVLVLSHTAAAFITGTILASLIIGKTLSSKMLSYDIEKFNLSYSLVIFFWVVMLAWWIYTMYYPSRSFFEATFGWFADALKIDAQYTGIAYKTSDVPMAILNRMQFLLTIIFIIIGSLTMLLPTISNIRRMAVIAAILIVTGIVFIFPYIGIDNLFPGRWRAFIAVAAAPIVALGMFSLSRMFVGGVKNALFLVLIVFTFSAFSVNSFGVNTATPFYGADYMRDPFRYAFYETELSAVDSISAKYDGTITTDNYYGKLPFKTRIGLGRVNDLALKDEPVGLTVIRKYIYTHEFDAGGREPASTVFLNSFNSNKYNMVFNNSDVKAYSLR